MTTATWRPYWARIIPYVLAAVVVVGMVVLAVAMPSNWGLGDRIGLIVIGLIVGGILHMLARSRVIADDRGLTLVNALRTHEYEWAEVLSVTMAEGAPWPDPSRPAFSRAGAAAAASRPPRWPGRARPP
jgi:hypothetical protein